MVFESCALVSPISSARRESGTHTSVIITKRYRGLGKDWREVRVGVGVRVSVRVGVRVSHLLVRVGCDGGPEGLFPSLPHLQGLGLGLEVGQGWGWG